VSDFVERVLDEFYAEALLLIAEVNAHPGLDPQFCNDDVRQGTLNAGHPTNSGYGSLDRLINDCCHFGAVSLNYWLLPQVDDVGKFTLVIVREGDLTFVVPDRLEWSGEPVPWFGDHPVLSNPVLVLRWMRFGLSAAAVLHPRHGVGRAGTYFGFRMENSDFVQDFGYPHYLRPVVGPFDERHVNGNKIYDAWFEAGCPPSAINNPHVQFDTELDVEDHRLND
jgi:hypothetical protein